MMSIWLSAFLMALVAFNFATVAPKQQAEQTALTADLVATSILAYRQAIKDYSTNFPDRTGEVADLYLSFYRPSGGTMLNQNTIPSMRNIVSGGVIYIYTTSPLSTATVLALMKKAYPSPVGTRTGNTLISLTNTTYEVAMPPEIPAGALVIAM